MPNDNNTARFTAPNIAAVLRALPDTDGTYHAVIRQVSEYGVALSPSTLGKWLSNGRADIKANKRQTAYARFAQKFDQLKREHCAADANRNREFDLALQILERTCECGNDKIILPDGTLGDTCRQCQDIEDHGRPPRRST